MYMPSSSPAIVVEVECTAPRRDWPELASLLCSHLRQRLSLSQDGQGSFPFYPGRRVHWGKEGSTAGDGASTTNPSSLLRDAIATLCVCDMTDPALLLRAPSSPSAGGLAAADVTFHPVFYSVHGGDDGEGEKEEEEEGGEFRCGGGDAELPCCTVLSLPHRSLEGLWESLSYGESVRESVAMKKDLVEYVQTAMLFTAAGVDGHCITWNRMVLLHGPPGTGKTSLCKALANKLAVRLCGFTGCATSGGSSPTDAVHGDTTVLPAAASSAATGGAATAHSNLLFGCARLVEVNAHSLFSRWFSESGKQVMQLFTRIRAMAADPNCFVCVLLDEVESLAAARQSAMRGNEPSDAIRVVNALLTQMDRLQNLRNVLVLTTSNLTGAIDVAFLDRADKKMYVGPPGREARCAMLQAAVKELLQRGLLYFPEPAEKTRGEGAVTVNSDGTDEEDRPRRDDPIERAMMAIEAVADDCAGFNGRLLKKLPFLAYSTCMSAATTTTAHGDLGREQQGCHGRAGGGGAMWQTRTLPAAVFAPFTNTSATSHVLKPTFIGGGGDGSSSSSNSSRSRLVPLPSVAVEVYLSILHEAVRKEREGQAQMASPTLR